MYTSAPKELLDSHAIEIAENIVVFASLVALKFLSICFLLRPFHFVQASYRSKVEPFFGYVLLSSSYEHRNRL